MSSRPPTHPFFDGLSPAHLAALTPISEERTIPKDHYLFREDEPAHGFYLVLSGEISLEMHASPGGTIQLETAGPGALVGFSWLFAPYRWHLDARARELSVVQRLDAQRLRAMIEADHHLGFEIEKRLLAQMYERLQRGRLQRLDVYGRKKR